MADTWMADVQISMPVAVEVEQPVLFDFGGGFAFTTGGMVHNITQAQRDLMLLPTYSPEGS